MEKFNYSDLVSRNYLNISPHLQDKIKQTRLAFIGCGLCSQVAEHAARIGYTQFKLLDYDTVEVSNLNRQAFTFHDVGKGKVSVVKERILSINPEAHVVSRTAKISNKADMMKSIENADIIINTMDCGPEYFEFVELARQAHKLILCPFNAGFSAVVICFSDASDSIYETLQTETPLMNLNFYARLLQLNPHISLRGFTETDPQKIFARIHQQGYDPQIFIGVNLASCLLHACMIRYLNQEEVVLAKKINYVSV